MKIVLPLILAVSCVAGCGFEPGDKELDGLSQAGKVVLTTFEVGEIPAARWPLAISRVGPERVYVTADGLYIVTSSFFVAEQGLFVPRDTEFMPQVGSDPSYVSLRDGVFSYRIEG